jgi:hypothetical protein
MEETDMGMDPIVGVVPSQPQSARLSAAHLLDPVQRQTLAIAALSGVQSITCLAQDYQVSRKFVYQQSDQAARALEETFAPAPEDDDLVLFYLPVTEAWLRRFILALLLICHSSYRGVFELLRDLFGFTRSLGYIHHVAHTAMDRARVLNQQQDLSAVGIGAHDELFQNRKPVLVGVDVASTYCYLLSLEHQRDAVTWGVRLLDLQTRGFAPQAIIGDAGAGLLAGQDLTLPNTPRRNDVFHVLKEVTPLGTFLENRAYQALETCARLEQQQAQCQRKKGRANTSVSQQLRHARPAADAAIALADDVATLVGWLRYDVLALAGPCHAERCALYDFIVSELQARVAQCPHRLRPICTYLANQRDGVLAFTQQLDADLERVAEQFQVPLVAVRALLYAQALPMHDRRRWLGKAALRAQLRGRFYEVSQAVAAVARHTVRASSVVENLNSRLRNYFFLRRHLGPDYLHLLQFFLNHRRFLRSEHAERVDQSPVELLTGNRHAHWLEMLGLPDPLRN